MGWRIEVNVERKTKLLLEGVDFESAEGFVGCDFGTLTLPPWRGLKAGSGLLESVKKEPGAAVIDAIVRECVDDLLNPGLYGMHVVEDGHLEARAGLAVQTCMRGLHAAGASVEMKIAITLIV
jgi:hypothetical protein